MQKIRKTHIMLNLTQIFPANYPNMPTAEELNFEVQEMLRRCDNDKQIMDWLNHIPCPYMRKAICLCFQGKWHELEKLRDDRTGYYDSDGGWRIAWLYMDSDIKLIVKKANLQQIELERKHSQQEEMTIHNNSNTHNIMSKESQPTQPIKMENCNVFMAPVYNATFPLPGAHVDVHQYAADAKGKPAQTTQGPVEAAEDRLQRKQAAIKDMCKRLDNLEENMIGYDKDGNRFKYAMLSALLRKALGILEGRPDSPYQAIQEGIWTILIDNRSKCTKGPKEIFFSQTFLGIIGYLIQQEVIIGKPQNILECLYDRPEASMRKCLERAIVSAFPDGTEDMLDFYINQLKQGTLI